MNYKWDFLDSLDALSEDLKSQGEFTARLFKELKKERDELRECLRWYVENDVTNNVSYKIDKDYLDGKHKAMRALGMEVGDEQ